MSASPRPAAPSPLTELRKFVAPEVVSGPGALRLAGPYARNLGVRHALLVSDAGVVAAGWRDHAMASLRGAGVAVTCSEAITPNPRVSEVMLGADAYRRSGCDGLVAVGGGSPIDAAKAIGILVSNGGDVQRYEGVDRIEMAIPPLVCIPTTGGSAADVSQFAIISDHERRSKFGIVSRAIVPDVSLIDPEPLTTMPPAITAGTGVDALSHAMEAYASNAASPLTDLFALEAVRLLVAPGGLRRCLEAPSDLAARAQTARAAMLAGLAFSNAILGVVHALAHAVGGLRDTPHGHTNALLLEHAVRYNFPAAPERYRALAEAMGVALAGGADAGEALASAVRSLRRDVGFTGTLAGLGVEPGDVPELASVAMLDPCLATNPRMPTRAELEALLVQAL